MLFQDDLPARRQVGRRNHVAAVSRLDVPSPTYTAMTVYVVASLPPSPYGLRRTGRSADHGAQQSSNHAPPRRSLNSLD